MRLFPGVLCALAGAVAMLCSFHVAGQAYPSRAVTAILAAAPGSSSEKEARLYLERIGTAMGQQFILDYKPGAGGTIGSGHVAKSKPDGHTLLLVTGSFTTFPALYKDLSFDPMKDLAPIVLMSQRTSVLAVHPSFPARTFSDYLAYARVNPGRINFADTGSGTLQHLAGAWIHSASNTTATFVHYKGLSLLTADFLAGRVDAVPLGLLAAVPLVKAGKVRVLAIMNTKRSELLPGVPTIAERDIPGYDYAAWSGFSAPAGTAAVIINKLNEGFVVVAKSPDVVASMDAEGTAMVGSTPAQFGQFLRSEINRWKMVVEQANIQLQE